MSKIPKGRITTVRTCVPYESDEFFERLDKAANTFSEDYCYMVGMRPCIRRYMSDGVDCITKKGEDLVYPVGLHILGECDIEDEDVECPKIGLIVKGEKYGWFITGEEDYKEGLKPERLRYIEKQKKIII